MNILDTIVEHKKIEVLKRKRRYSLIDLQSFDLYSRNPLSIEVSEKVSGIRHQASGNLKPGSGTRHLAPDTRYPAPGIIAEFKRKSPSKGTINAEADPVVVSRAYREGGVAAMSILTDRDFFGGSLKDLQAVKKESPELCLLRKDFIIDPFQVYESKAYGADIILLIASILSKEEVRDMAGLADELGLQVLFEVHNREEIEKYTKGIDLVGVNNRNLKDFSVDINNSLNLVEHFPAGVIPVSESGLCGPEEIRLLFKSGFKLFLMGESFMKAKDPGEACLSFIKELGA